jgi:hypothetical protein
MVRTPFAARALLVGSSVLTMLLAGGCPPKLPPPKMPPKEVPRINQVSNSDGERADVVADAVQQGSNQARVLYDCGPPASQGIEGKRVLSAEISKCVFDFAQKTLVIGNDNQAECSTFLLTISGYHGQGTYNTSGLGKLSLGTAKMRSAACGWDGTMCLDWNGSSGPHPEASCTVEITNDPGVQYGTVSSGTVSGTFVCSDFLDPWKGCAGAPAKVNCSVARASFSVAGCTVINKDNEDPRKKKKKPAAPKG